MDATYTIESSSHYSEAHVRELERQLSHLRKYKRNSRVAMRNLQAALERSKRETANERRTVSKLLKFAIEADRRSIDAESTLRRAAECLGARRGWLERFFGR